jgi:hypothetical protein
MKSRTVDHLLSPKPKYCHAAMQALPSIAKAKEGHAGLAVIKIPEQSRLKVLEIKS